MALLQAQLNSLQQLEQRQQHHRLPVQSKKQRLIILDEEDYESEEDEDFWYYDSNEKAFMERRPHKKYRESHSIRVKPASPLSIELEQADWPPKFKLPASLPEYDGESDPDNSYRSTLWQYLRVVGTILLWKEQ
jgi:hypothetical protein